MSTQRQKSPFRFLDAFRYEDYASFFGRSKEVDALYSFVNKNRAVLVYGQSGTGKTSIIQCGLAQKFDVTEWKPFFIRRRENLNDSLKAELMKPLKQDIWNDKAKVANEINELQVQLFGAQPAKDDSLNYDDDDKAAVAELVYILQKLTEQYIRPLYLIFDQFEELLILADDSERDRFIKTIKILLEPLPYVDCHILIVMREEYFAWLEDFEQHIPKLVERRLRIEPMRREQVREVITKSCRAFNISLVGDETGTFTELIIDALTQRTNIALPYLQVYMVQLWRMAFEKQYPDGYTGVGNPPLEISTEDIRSLGMIKDVMQRFLVEQREIFKEKANKDGFELPENFLSQVLDCFVNDLGTKNPLSYRITAQGYYEFKQSPDFIKDADPAAVKYAIDFLVESQILRNEKPILEFAHDSIAKLVEKQRDSKQLRLNGIRVLIDHYLKTAPNELIPADLIKRWDRHIDELHLKPEQRELFDKSKKAAEENEKQEILAEDKVQRRKRQNKILILSLLAACTLLYIIFRITIENSDIYYAKSVVYDISGKESDADIIKMAKYIYDNSDDDTVKNEIGRPWIMRLIKNVRVGQETSLHSFQDNPGIAFVPGLDMDISKSGTFFAIRKDSYTNANNGTFVVYNTRLRKAIGKFENISYSYFLHNSDTLLLAIVKDEKGIQLVKDRPDEFILYDCKTGKSDTVKLNHRGYNHVLYSKDFLRSSEYSDLDNYKVRKMANGDLIIPHMAIMAESSQGQPSSIYRLQVLNDKKFASNSEASVSQSASLDRILFFYRNDKKQDIFCIYNENGEKRLIPNTSTFADFTKEGSIMMAKAEQFYLLDKKGVEIDRFTCQNPISWAAARGTDEFVIATGYAGEHLRIINLKTRKETYFENENLLGYDLEDRIIITKSTFNDKQKTEYIFVRDFSGKLIDIPSKPVPLGIQRATYNANTNSLLVLGKPSAESESLLYLFTISESIETKGSFYVDPNAIFMFSENGSSFVVTRNNEVFFYEVRKYLDVSDFSSVNKWLEQQSKSKAYKTTFEQLLKRYGDFPSKKYSLF